MGNEAQQVSGDALRALEEFRQDFAMALAAGTVEDWASKLGLSAVSRALKTTYPIPVSAALYKEFKGDIKYRDLFAKFLTMSPKTWQDGVAALASVIEAPDFTGWAEQPAAMAGNAQQLPNTIIAGLLKANAVQELDGKAYFANDHPVNVFDDSKGVFDNDLSGAVSRAGLVACKKHFRGLKAPNGLPLGTRMTHMVVGPDDEEEAKDLLESDMIIESGAGATFGAVTNRHKNTVELVVMDEFDDGTNWYGLALNKPGLYPWVVQTEGVPEQIISDKNSALYQTTLQVGIAMILRANGALALPQCAVRMDGMD